MIQLRNALWLAILVTLLIGCDAPPAIPPLDFTPEPTQTEPEPTVATGTSATDDGAVNTTDATGDSAASTATPTPNDTNDPLADVAMNTPAVLPAPVYFIGTVTQQVMRLERDGITVSQVTAHEGRVEAFDYSSTTNTLVFVSNNQLIAQTGENSTLLFEGERIDATNPNRQLEVRAPSLSPDGTQVVFAYGGIMRIYVDGRGDPEMLIASSEIPDFSDPDVEVPEGPLYYFGRAEYAPSGQQLIIHFGYFPEGGGIGLYELETSTFTDISQAAGRAGAVGCCEFAWNAAGTSGYIISEAQIYGSPGLALFDAATQQVRSVVNGFGDQDTPSMLFRSGHVTEDGSILTFVATSEYPGAESYYQLMQITSNGEQTPVGGNGFYLGRQDILWADDGSGVLFTNQAYNSNAGNIEWLRLSDDARVQLPFSGEQMMWGEAAQAVDMISAEAVAQLTTQATADFDLPADWPSEEVEARSLLVANDMIWVAYTMGGRTYDESNKGHRIGLYRYANESWEPLYIGDLDNLAGDIGESYGPDYMGDVAQAFIEPSTLWLTITGGVGAHGGVLQLLRFDGTELVEMAVGSNGTPFAGYTADLNGDGWHELILDQTDAYVFCYACSVRLGNYEVMRWNGSALETVQLEKVEGNADINRAIDLANGDLWYDAENIVRSLENSNDPAVRWNAALIQLTAGARGQLADSPYPLISHMFYGNYAAATYSSMDGLSLEEIFDINGPLIVGTVAEGWTEFMFPQIIDFSSRAIAAQPDNGGAYFLRGWASYMIDPTNPEAVADVQKSAELNPNNFLYPDAAAYLSNQ